MRPRHIPDIIVEVHPVHSGGPAPGNSELLNASLNVVVADERTVDGPEDLTHKTTAQTGFYTHRGLDEQASSIRPGASTPDPPPPVASSRPWMDPRGRHRKMRERFSERVKSTYSSPGLGFGAYLRFFRERSA